MRKKERSWPWGSGVRREREKRTGNGNGNGSAKWEYEMGKWGVFSFERDLYEGVKADESQESRRRGKCRRRM